MSDDVTPSRELATVTRLPSRRDGEVLDGEIVTEEQWRELTSQRSKALARREAYRQDVTRAVAVTRTVVTHERTVTATKFAARHSAYVLAGVGVVVKRAWDAKTNSVPNRMVRAAEARGDMDAVERWYQHGQQAKKDRHGRVMEWLKAPVEWLKALLVGVVAAVAMLVLLGIAIAFYTEDVGDVLAPLRLAIWLIWATWTVLLFIGAFLPVIGVTVIVTALWVLGKRAGVTSAWLAPAGAKRDGEPITPSVVVTAYRDLGIPELAKRIRAMEDAGAAMVGPIRIAGCGVEFDVTPPRGATSTAAILARRDRLAENMGRHPYELHLSITARGVIRNWAADPGALDEPVGTSPLVFDEDLRADYRRGKAPWGVNLRGDRVEISLFQRHLLVTGQSNQGKSRAIIALALWLALDPNPELRIADLKGINDKTGVSDWEPFRDIATVLIAGPTDDHVAAATEMLEDAVQEMNRRLTDGGPWKPLIVIVDEAQKAYMCPLVGPDGRPYGGRKAKSRFFTAARELHNQGRVVDVLLWQGTQDPNNDNLPEMVREGAHIRGCLAIGTASKAGMALGEKAVEAGAAPHHLRPGRDRGTLVVAGDGAPVDDPAQLSVTVRTYFIDHDAACEIAGRAKTLRGPVRKRVTLEQDRDLLLDVEQALGEDEMVKATDVAARLRKLDPAHRPYTHLNGQQLVELLAREGVEVKPRDGYPMVRRDRIGWAIADREGRETDGSE